MAESDMNEALRVIHEHLMTNSAMYREAAEANLPGLMTRLQLRELEDCCGRFCAAKPGGYFPFAANNHSTTAHRCASHKTRLDDDFSVSQPPPTK